MNQYDLGVLSKTNSWLRPVRREKILDGSSNFDDVSLKGKMPGVKELDASVRYVLSISLCALRGCGSHSGQIFGNLIEQVVEGCPKTREGDAQNGD